jgi:hypothetical protein
VTWVGTDLELLEYLEAAGQHCTCPDRAAGRCGADDLVDADQATINRMIFFRRIAARLCREEWAPAAFASG